MYLRKLFLLGPLALLLAAPAAAQNEVEVIASDFSFQAPDELPAGPTTFRLVNRGPAIHHAQIMRLEDGKTLEDLLAAFQSHGPPPAWLKAVGGPNAPDPGAEAIGTVVLEPGNYAIVCFVDMPDHIPHFVKGMVRAFRVTPALVQASATEPRADATMTLSDYDFQLSAPLTAGRRTIRVENAGPQAHEVELVRLAPGKTAQDLMGWMQEMQGPPPGSAIGGVAGLDPGRHASFTADLTPGEYVLICFIPDSKDGKPHLAHGMMKTITVQ